MTIYGWSLFSNQYKSCPSTDKDVAWRTHLLVAVCCGYVFVLVIIFITLYLTCNKAKLSSSSNSPPEAELSEELHARVMEVFKIFDTDDSKNIDKTEAIEHWKSNFGKISARKFFEQVDFDGNGEISQEEFERFWRIVKGAGHTEKDIF